MSMENGKYSDGNYIRVVCVYICTYTHSHSSAHINCTVVVIMQIALNRWGFSGAILNPNVLKWTMW